jgi:hypothetical protein
MWRQASTSDRAARGFARAVQAAVSAAAVLATAVLPGAAAELLTADQALRGAFGPSAAALKRTSFLDDAQLAMIESLAGERPASKIVTWFEVRDAEGALLGRAWLDTHLVRTLQETLLISIGNEGRVRRVDVLSFREPREYLPSERWIGQFDGRGLDDDLRLRRGVRVLAGATLSSRSITAAARRALALDRVIGRGERPR